MIQAKVEIFPLAHVFRISRGARPLAEVVTVTLENDGVPGRGECVPYARYNETLESVINQVESLPADIDKETLQDTLPPGAARNAVDCALWDFECKKRDQRIWKIAGIQVPEQKITAYTLSLDECTTLDELHKIIDSQVEFPNKADTMTHVLDAVGDYKWLSIPYRKKEWLTQEVFNKYHSETDMMRYIYELSSKDFSLVNGMMPLGSCCLLYTSDAADE